MSVRLCCLLTVAIPVVFSTTAVAQDTTLGLRYSHMGTKGVFISGAPLAIDTNGDFRLDTLQAADLDVTESDVPADSFLVQALLYWAGTIAESPNNCTPPSTVDDTVEFTPPSGGASLVTADICYCSDGSNTGYDIQLCRKDVTSLVSNSNLTGVYSVDGFSAAVNDGSADNASFAIILVFQPGSDSSIGIFDGLVTFQSSTETLTLDGGIVDTPPSGDLAWYVLDGDPGGQATDQVSVQGMPGGLSWIVNDSVNPIDNPMNRTINTTFLPQADTIGVDIDRFDISAALTQGDTSTETTFSTGTDKWWLALVVQRLGGFAEEIFEDGFENGTDPEWSATFPN